MHGALVYFGSIVIAGVLCDYAVSEHFLCYVSKSDRIRSQNGWAVICEALLCWFLRAIGDFRPLFNFDAYLLLLCPA